MAHHITSVIPMTRRKRLIEVALPLDAINAASRREKSIRHGHPSTLHLWWARRPLAAARAVIFAQMVDDPSADPERFPTKEDQERERERLFRLLEQLVLWVRTRRTRTCRPRPGRHRARPGGIHPLRDVGLWSLVPPNLTQPIKCCMRPATSPRRWELKKAGWYPLG